MEDDFTHITHGGIERLVLIYLFRLNFARFDANIDMFCLADLSSGSNTNFL